MYIPNDDTLVSLYTILWEGKIAFKGKRGNLYSQGFTFYKPGKQVIKQKGEKTALKKALACGMGRVEWCQLPPKI